MEAPRSIQKDLAAFGKTPEGGPRYRMHWTGDPMPGFPEHKFATPIDCWALIWWVDTDSERPSAGGGYAVLQAFYTQESGVFTPTMLDSVGLNARVLTMMAGEAERHRHDFARLRHAMLKRQRARAGEVISNQIADVLADAMPQFKGPTSFQGGGALPTVVERKVEQLENFFRRVGSGTVAQMRRKFTGREIEKPRRIGA